MQELLEVRWHGRGGQGAKTAAQILAECAMDSGAYIQAFPEYGPERAGAPMQAFTRIADEPIKLHSGIKAPDIVVVLDPTLLGSVDVANGLKDAGLLLVNSSEEPEKLREQCNCESGEVAAVDATGIALDTIDLPMPNIPLLGALVKLREIITLEELKKGVQKKMEKKIGTEKTEGNIRGIEEAYQGVRIWRKEDGETSPSGE